MKHFYYVYILTNKSLTLYIGVTNNLVKRIWEHKEKLVEDFTKKYNINQLIYFEEYQDIKDALEREKQLKKWSRSKKMNLIKLKNPNIKEIIL